MFRLNHLFEIFMMVFVRQVKDVLPVIFKGIYKVGRINPCVHVLSFF